MLNPKELINIVDHLQALIDDAFTDKDIFIMERTSDGCIAVSGLDKDIIVDLENPMQAMSPLSMTDSSYGSEFDFDFETRLSDSRGQDTETLQNRLFKTPTYNSYSKYASHYAGIVAISALKLLGDSSKINVPLPDNKQLQIRIALHSAPCSGGVVGLQTSAVSSNIPRYKLFGPPLRYTSNLCRTGLALQIRVSKSCRDLLAKCKNFSFERCPDYMIWETKKPIESYWLVGKVGMTIKLPSLDYALSLSEYENVED